MNSIALNADGEKNYGRGNFDPKAFFSYLLSDKKDAGSVSTKASTTESAVVE